MRLHLRGTAFNVVDQGRGDPALVLLHHFGGSARSWSPLIERLAGGHRCVAPDLRGFGASDRPGTGYSVSEGADDVAALVEALGLRDYVLVGHSMGGKIAQALAARRPAGLRALVLIAPSPPTPEPIPDAQRSHLLASHGDPEAAREVAAKITRRRPPDPLVRQVVEDNLRTSREAWTAWLEAGSREDISGAAKRIQVPALVIVGEEDDTIPRETVEREVMGRLARAERIAIPWAKHLVPLDAPTALAGAMTRWLAGARIGGKQPWHTDDVTDRSSDRRPPLPPASAA